MASPHSDAPQQHGPFNVLLALCRLPSAGVHRRPALPPPLCGRAPLDAVDRCLQEAAAAAADHPLLKPFFSFHSHLRAFSQSRRRVAMQRSPISKHCFAAILGDSVAALVVSNGINNFLSLYNTLLVVRLLLTWFPNTPPAIVSPLSTICDPYLNIFRGIIPPLGGTLDLSPILAFLVLNAFTSTAAALPAELPATATSHKFTSSDAMPIYLTANQRKWMQRIRSKERKQDGEAR